MMSIEKNYSQQISKVFQEFGGSFAALASPTLSKQETVTSLFYVITEGIKRGRSVSPFPWYNVVLFIPRLLLMFSRIAYASLRYRAQSIPEDAIIFRTWLVPRSLAGTELIDDYFRQLPKEIAENENVIVTFTSTDIGLLNQFGKIRRDENQIVSYGLLSMFDVVRFFWDFVTTALLKAKQIYILDGKNITDYINRSFLCDYLELRSLEAYAEKYKCNRLAQYKIKAFVYVYENQSWEKVCCKILRNHGVRLIGYQSSGFSPVFLNFFPTMEDAGQQPMPDILLTVGDNFRRYLKENGHYNIRVEPFAALRFSYAAIGGSYLVQPANPKVVGAILYAFPVHIGQYSNIIADLIKVFQGSGIKVDLKLHPLYQLNDVKGISNLPDNFRVVTDVDMDSLCKVYDCVLFNDNSFGIESLLKGVRSYQYSRDGSFLDDRFMYFDLWKVNYLLDDVYLLKDAIKNKSYEKEFSVEAVSDYINAMYHPYNRDSYNKFCELLSSARLTR